MIPQYMKTAKILLMTLCSLVVLSCAKDKTYSYQDFGLNCPVKSIKVTTYAAGLKSGEVVKGNRKRYGNYLAEFNSVGNIITLTEYYDNDCDINSVVKYKYNNDDNIIEDALYDKDGELCKSHSFEYNGFLLSKITSTFKYTTEEVYVNEFFRDGETIIKETLHHNGELISVTKYNKNDKTGAEWVCYDGDGKEVEKGSCIRNDGKLTRFNLNDKDYYEVTWNEKGLPIYLKNAELHNSSFIHYNFLDDSIFHIEYEYDKKGNWIKQTLFKGELKKPVTISERVIVY
jgi:hypothetical protein